VTLPDADPFDPGAAGVLERLERVLAAADVGCFDWDIPRDHLIWDERLLRILGVDPAGVDGRIGTLYDVVVPDDLPDVLVALQHAIDTCGDFHAEFRVRRPDGAARWVDARGRVTAGPDGVAVRLLGVARDSTELRLARDTVARTLEHMADAFLAVDTAWRVTYINRPAAELMRVDRLAAPGQTLWDLWPSLAAAGNDEAFHTAVETHEATTFATYDVERERWHELRVVPAPDGVSVFATDVTAVRAVERERSRELARPEQSRRVLAYSQAFAQADSVADVTEVVATMVLPAFDATGLLVSLVDSGKLRLAGHAGYPLRAREALDGLPIDADVPIAQVLRSREPQFLPSRAAYLARYPLLGPLIEMSGKHAWAFVPLTVSGRALGSLTISFDAPRELAPEERSLIVSLAGLLGQTLERARLRDAERGLAAELQRGLLPRAIAQQRGLAASARYLPATDGMMVGGDWYELITLSADRVALVIGDVQGHNVHAASTMGQLRNGLRAYATEGHDPVAIASRSNRLMTELDPHLFATCCLLEIDLPTGRAQMVRAGHPPPLVRSADGRTRLLDDAPVGLPLGVDPDETYLSTVVQLVAGDTLVLITDGLVEDSRTPMADGLAQLAATMSATLPGDLETFTDALVARPMAAAHRSDDIAVLAVRFDGLDEMSRPPSAMLSVDRADPRAARNAREFIATALHGWDLDDLRETTVLLVSEVVTNALRHTAGRVELTMSRLPGRLRVEVADDMSVAPQRRGGEPLDEAGRGVPLLGGFSDRWGTAPRGPGKIVWFELDA
jgi:serine phosphatase RsbU (regulator of sigma subunit)/PAS domain-containing protein/anti-sigma regulatory factor (Ser/Thr protein kinase)